MGVEGDFEGHGKCETQRVKENAAFGTVVAKARDMVPTCHAVEGGFGVR